MDLRVDWKLAKLQGSKGCDQQHILVLSCDEAKPGVLCPSLSSPVHKTYGATGEGSAKGHKDDERTGASYIWGRAERAGIVQQRLRGGLIIWWKTKDGGAILLSVETSRRIRWNCHKLKHRNFCLNIKKVAFAWLSTATGLPCCILEDIQKLSGHSSSQLSPADTAWTWYWTRQQVSHPMLKYSAIP